MASNIQKFFITTAAAIAGIAGTAKSQTLVEASLGYVQVSGEDTYVPVSKNNMTEVAVDTVTGKTRTVTKEQNGRNYSTIITYDDKKITVTQKMPKNFCNVTFDTLNCTKKYEFYRNGKLTSCETYYEDTGSVDCQKFNKNGELTEFQRTNRDGAVIGIVTIK